MKINHMALAICLGAVPLASAAATPVEQTLKFSATIPADDFKIEPGTPWPAAGMVTEFKYDQVKNSFTRYTNPLTITSLNQDVMAKIQSSAVLSDGANKISVHVGLARKMLTTTPQLIHSKGPNAGTYELDIVPGGTSRPKAGTYTGDIVLIFDGV